MDAVAKKLSLLSIVCDRFLMRVETAFLLVLFFAMVGLSFLQILLRMTGVGGILWADPLLRNFTLWAGFLGAAVAVSHKKHFAIDLLKTRLSRRFYFLAKILVDCFHLLVLFFLTQSAWHFFAEEKQFASTLFSIGHWEIYGYYFEVGIPITFSLLSLHVLLGLWIPPEEKKSSTDIKEYLA